MNPEQCKDIQEVRKNIDAIDREIIALISKRAGYVKAAAKFKKTTAEVKAADRVRFMIESRRQWAQELQLNPDLIEGVYRTMVSFFIKEEMKEFHKQADRKPKPVHYDTKALALKEDVPGAKMWGVALENTMLTYFEVEANSAFDPHAHESEQITCVLEGELIFTTDDGEITVKQGDAIAFPSNVRHGTLTRGKAAKAVDAWSPVMDKYRG